MKKISLIILGSLLLSSTTLSCPDKELHDNATEFITASEGLYIEDGKLYVVTNILADELLALYKGDYDEASEDGKTLIEILYFYADQHNLKLEELN